MSIEIKTVRTDRFSMRYFSFGTGSRTMVILPGLSLQSVMGLADAVAESYRSLTEDFTVYVFDRREELPESYTVYDMGRDTAEAMQVLGLQGVYLFGASQGGMMAQVIAIEYPELVHRMVLGSTSSHVLPEQYAVIEEWIRLAEAKNAEALCLDFGRRIYPPAVFEQLRGALAEAGKAATGEELRRFVILARAIKDFSVVDRLHEIRCPVLAIGDAGDEVLDADATMEIAEKLDFRPDFRLYLYTGFGHAAFDTAPGYRRRILDFFKD